MFNFLSMMFRPDFLWFLGLTAGALSIAAFLPYVRDTIAGRTQPERASWLIWSMLSAIAFGSLVYEGATASLWFVGIQSSATILIFGLSIKNGHGRYLCRRNAPVFGIVAMCLIAWYLAETAVYALAISIIIGFLGGVPTIRKAFRDPASETLSTWCLSFLAAAFAVLSVGRFDWVILAYPMYLLALYAALVVATLAGRARIARSGSAAFALPVFKMAPRPPCRPASKSDRRSF